MAGGIFEEKFGKNPLKMMPYVAGLLVLECYLIGVYATKSLNPLCHAQKFVGRAIEARLENKQRNYLMGVLDVVMDKNGNGEFESDEKKLRDSYLEKIKKENPSLSELTNIVMNAK